MSEFDWGAFWAAGFGAGAAFALEGGRRWLARSKAECNAANDALLTLIQMHSHLGSLLKDAYDDRHALAQAQAGRNAHPYELPALVGVVDHGIRLDISALSFFLRSHDPDLPNRLAVLERRFITCILNEQERVVLYRKFQETLAARGVLDPSKLNVAAIDAILGPALSNQIKSLSTQSEVQCRETCAAIVEAQATLAAVARLHFPMRGIIRIVDPDTAATPNKAAWWRRLIFSLRRHRNATWAEMH